MSEEAELERAKLLAENDRLVLENQNLRMQLDSTHAQIAQAIGTVAEARLGTTNLPTLSTFFRDREAGASDEPR
jgi:regulator of replication initiation timing